jgi:hypothetical protein
MAYDDIQNPNDPDYAAVGGGLLFTPAEFTRIVTCADCGDQYTSIAALKQHRAEEHGERDKEHYGTIGTVGGISGTSRTRTYGSQANPGEASGTARRDTG